MGFPLAHSCPKANQGFLFHIITASRGALALGDCVCVRLFICFEGERVPKPWKRANGPSPSSARSWAEVVEFPQCGPCCPSQGPPGLTLHPRPHHPACRVISPPPPNPCPCHTRDRELFQHSALASSLYPACLSLPLGSQSLCGRLKNITKRTAPPLILTLSILFPQSQWERP